MDRLLRHALAASLIVHGAILLARGPVTNLQPPPPPLEARLLSPEPPNETRPTPLPPPRASSPAQANQRTPRPERKILAAAAPTPTASATTPIAPEEPAPTPVITNAVVTPAPPAPLEPPRFDAAYLANPPPPYPLSARRRGIEGTATVEARIGPEGDAREVRLANSAGDAALDTAALEAVRHWRFVPARRGGQAVEAWVRIPLVFRLN